MRGSRFYRGKIPIEMVDNRDFFLLMKGRKES